MNSTHCISQYKQINSFKTGIQAKHTSTKNKENLNTAIISIKNYPAINLSHHRLDTKQVLNSYSGRRFLCLFYIIITTAAMLCQHTFCRLILPFSTPLTTGVIFLIFCCTLQSHQWSIFKPQSSKNLLKFRREINETFVLRDFACIHER